MTTPAAYHLHNSAHNRFYGSDHKFGILILAGLVLLIRKTDAFLNPQFWAEDFWPFFVDANAIGEIIWYQYNGYHHLLPRIIAWVSAFCDPSFQPALYVFFSLGITLGVVLQVLSSRHDLRGKMWCALAVVTVPHTGEVFLNPTNLQWITALALLITLFKKDPACFTDWAVDFLWLFFAGLTGPFSVLFFPLFLARAIYRRSVGSWLILCFLAVPASVQGWQIMHAVPITNTTAFSWSKLIGVLSVRIPATLGLGSENSFKIGYLGAVTLGVLFSAAIVWSAIKKGISQEARLFTLAAIVITLAAAVLRMRLDTWAFDDIVNGDRYLFVPKILCLWLIVYLIHETLSGWRQRVVYGMALCAIGMNLSNFRFKPYEDLKWAKYCPAIRAGKEIEIPINPGWKKIYPAKN
jgi:hypothetical protein